MLRASETLSHSYIVWVLGPSPHTSFFPTLPFPWYLEHHTWNTESGVQDTPHLARVDHQAASQAHSYMTICGLPDKLWAPSMQPLLAWIPARLIS